MAQVTTPVSKKNTSAKPAAKGIAGHVLAQNLIVQAIATATKKEAMKDTLKRIQEFSLDDHTQFCAELNAELAVHHAHAKGADVSFSAWRRNNSEADCVAVTVSLWRKMSKAIEDGFVPDYSMKWAELSELATAVTRIEPVAGKTKMESLQELMGEQDVVRIKGKPAAPAPTSFATAQAIFIGLDVKDQHAFMEWAEANMAQAVKIEAEKIAKAEAMQKKIKAVDKTANDAIKAIQHKARQDKLAKAAQPIPV